MRLAVSDRISTLCSERESLVGLITAAANASRMTGATGQLRYQNLLASGLSDVQICSLGEDLRNPAVVTAEMQARITAIDALVVPLFVFSKDPLGDVTPLAGLGLDDLIAARLDAEAAA